MKLGCSEIACIIEHKSAGLPVAVRDANASLAYPSFESRAVCTAFVVVGRTG